MENVNVVVICNGESVLEYLLGEVINRIDVVVRIGNFKLLNYENYVGNKTDVIIQRFKQTPDLTYATKKTEFWSPHKLTLSEPLIHSKSLTEVEISDIKQATRIDEPTTGLIAYFLIKKYISNAKIIYYHGIDFLKGGHYWNKIHSHSSVSLHENISHHSAKERIWFSKMLATKQIQKLTDYRLH